MIPDSLGGHTHRTLISSPTHKPCPAWQPRQCAATRSFTAPLCSDALPAPLDPDDRPVPLDAAEWLAPLDADESRVLMVADALPAPLDAAGLAVFCAALFKSGAALTSAGLCLEEEAARPRVWFLPLPSSGVTVAEERRTKPAVQ